MVLRHVAGVMLGVVCVTAAWSAPLKVVFVTGSAEYDTETSMPAYEQWLEAHYDVDVTLLKANGWEDLPGLEALETCDAALFFTRRLKISGEQLERVKRYLGGGKPIVAVRTARPPVKETTCEGELTSPRETPTTASRVLMPP